jgi:hypothetical protein
MRSGRSGGVCEDREVSQRPQVFHYPGIELQELPQRDLFAVVMQQAR